MMVSLPSGVMTRGRCAAASRDKRRNIEMIVVAVRHQHGIDRRQVGKGDAGIVDPLRPDEAKRRSALRPHRIEQHIETRGLNEKARMADIGNPPACAFDACRRPVGIRRRRPGRPLGPGCRASSDRPSSAAHPAGRAAARRRGRKTARRRNDRRLGRCNSATFCGVLYSLGGCRRRSHMPRLTEAGRCTYFPAALARDRS